jgi:hypothetical protein
MLDHALNVMPVWLAFFLFAAIPALIVCAVHDWVRRMVPADRLIPHHDVAGFLVSIVGLLYAVVLAFLVAASWTTFDSAQRNADGEASDVAEIFSTAEILPAPARSAVRSTMADYAFEVRDREWAMLATGVQDERARDLLLKAFGEAALARNTPTTSVPDALERGLEQQVVLSNLRDLSQARRERILDSQRHIPGELYLALILGWVVVTAFVFLFGVTGRRLQLTMTALLTAMIGLLFAVIVEFDLPYSHGIRVSTDAWTFVIENSQLAKYRTKPTVH